MPRAENTSSRTGVDPDDALGLGEMYALSLNQQRNVESQMGGFVPAMTAAWGVAWLIGFGALWMVDGTGPGVQIPLPLAIAIFAVSMLAGIGLSTWMGIRGSRGIRSSKGSEFTGAVYGATWSLGSVAIVAIGQGLSLNGMTAVVANFYYPTSFVMFTGLMYLAAGAIWHAKPAVLVGALLVVIAAAASFLPYPLHYLFFAVAGGGTFLCLAMVTAVYFRRLGREAAKGSRQAPGQGNRRG